jgi:hypothetical protein
MFLCFAIRSQQAGMEYVMDGPGGGELELISDWRNSLIDHKGAMMFGGEFGRSIREIKILRLEPDSVSNLELVHRSLFCRPVERLFCLPSSPRCYLDPVFRLLIRGGWGWLKGPSREIS